MSSGGRGFCWGAEEKEGGLGARPVSLKLVDVGVTGLKVDSVGASVYAVWVEARFDRLVCG